MKVNPEKRKGINFWILILSLVIVIIVSSIGSLFTSGNTNSLWFEQIKPSITPPNYIFPIVWSILFALMGISLYILINNKKKQSKNILILFSFNFLLNILWSFFYFSLKNPIYSFIDLILLLISLILIITFSWEKFRVVSYLNIPYFIWVSFAGVLNYLSILKI